MKTKILPRRCWKKLWAYCLKTSETGSVRVRVLSSNRDGYYLLRTDDRKRIGRAIPTYRRFADGFVSIEWSYVY